MPTTHEYRCWRPAMGKRRPDACGPTFATTDRQETRLLRQSGLGIHPIGEENTPSNICEPFEVHCRRMPMPASIGSIKMIAFKRWLVGRTCGASSMTWYKLTLRLWPGKLWNGSQVCMPSRVRSVDDLRTNDGRFAKPELAHCWSPCTNGSKPH